MARRGSNEGSIYRRSDGRWCARVTQADGRRKYYYGKTRAEVATRLTTALKAHQDGLSLPGEREKVAAYLARWIEGMRPNIRPKTWQRYEQYIRIHAIPVIGRLSLAKVQPQHLQQLYAQRLAAGLSATSAHHLHAVLHKAFDQAMKWNLIARNPVDLVDSPRANRKEMKALTPDQARHLLEATESHRLHALYVLAVTTGMRQGELFALRWKDVNLERGVLSVTGTLQRATGGFYDCRAQDDPISTTDRFKFICHRHACTT